MSAFTSLVYFIYLNIRVYLRMKFGNSDYRRMDEHDQYESVGLDDSMEDERDLDQIMADRRAAEAELDVRDVRSGGGRKLPRMLHDQGSDI